MCENYRQRGLPEYFKKNAITIDKDPSIVYAWHYKEAVELYEWLKSNDYIISKVQVFSRRFRKINPLNYSWNYHGDGNKNKEDNNKANFLAAFQFIVNIHSEVRSDLLYEILFESEKDMDEIEKEFYYKSIIHSGYNYALEDALELIGRCRIMGKRLHGVEVFKIEDPYIEPVDIMYFSGDEENLDTSIYYERFHMEKNDDFGNWKKSVLFIKRSTRPGYYFQITHE